MYAHTYNYIHTRVYMYIIRVHIHTHFRHTRFLNASGTRGLCVGVCTHMYVPVCCPLSKCVSILTCAHTHRFWGQAALHFNYTSLTSCSNLEPGDLDRVTELSWLLICSIRSTVSAPPGLLLTDRNIVPVSPLCAAEKQAVMLPGVVANENTSRTWSFISNCSLNKQ